MSIFDGDAPILSACAECVRKAPSWLRFCMHRLKSGNLILLEDFSSALCTICSFTFSSNSYLSFSDMSLRQFSSKWPSMPISNRTAGSEAVVSISPRSSSSLWAPSLSSYSSFALPSSQRISSFSQGFSLFSQVANCGLFSSSLLSTSATLAPSSPNLISSKPNQFSITLTWWVSSTLRAETSSALAAGPSLSTLNFLRTSSLKTKKN
mmetsp:Transcript_46519/g.122835  ORF Transcript_46519/g.122835 Transcript_46519/m.122835 type:complete len:208 (-) Transcript_46519:356-979(-)